MMCDYWKDFGYDDGGEVCRLSKKRTTCMADPKDCECPELKEKEDENNRD